VESESDAEGQMKRWITIALAVAAVAALACSMPSPPDIAKARSVMEKLLEAEREHRGSNGNYWRGTQQPIDRDDAIKNIGIDFSDAPGFEFVAEPREDGADTTLRVVARPAGGATGPSISCVLKASDGKPDCKESGS
jgi:hypothetical protein